MFSRTCRMCADTFQHETTTEWRMRRVTSNSTVLDGLGSVLCVDFRTFPLSFPLRRFLVTQERHSNPQINIQPMSLKLRNLHQIFNGMKTNQNFQNPKNSQNLKILNQKLNIVSQASGTSGAIEQFIETDLYHVQTVDGNIFMCFANN